ncbi:MAG: metallophosphoesterase [Rubrivivax sp.]|nr:metallophosphoesterase [Rubrivivax sp.]
MQYALVADIHANLEALQAVLRLLDERHPQARLLCPGDIVGYGPDPAACIELLRERQVPCVRGNHEEMVLGTRDFSRCVVAGITAARWTRQQLSSVQRQYLADLPLSRHISPELTMCHGDLLSADTYISHAEAGNLALQQLQSLAPQAQILVCGHTHHAALHSREDGFAVLTESVTLQLQPGRRYVINPGAVGQSRDGAPVARCAVLDLERHELTVHRLSYDHALTERKMRAAGLLGGVVLERPEGVWRRVEYHRTRWARYWGERENQRLGLTAKP